MLRGYDNYFSMVMDDVTIVEGAEKKLSKVESMLLNGHDIVYVYFQLLRWCRGPGLTIKRSDCL